MVCVFFVLELTGLSPGAIPHGDSSSIRHQLRNVQQICGAANAFAAILADGNVVMWGVPRSGGDSSRVQNQLYYI